MNKLYYFFIYFLVLLFYINNSFGNTLNRSICDRVETLNDSCMYVSEICLLCKNVSIN